VFQTYVASVSTVLDVCCKCCPLHIAKVDLVLHMLQWTPFAAAACCSCWARLHERGCGGARASGVGNCAGVDQDEASVEHGAVRDMERARDRSGAEPYARASGR